jgi:hypothetical protein
LRVSPSMGGAADLSMIVHHIIDGCHRANVPGIYSKGSAEANAEQSVLGR